MDFGSAWHDQPSLDIPLDGAMGSVPTLRDRRENEQRVLPYDAKFNMAEIGAVNMGVAMRTVTSLTRFPIDVASRRTPRGGDATTGNYPCSTTLRATHYVGCMYNIIINNNNTPHVVSST